jgi:hypothetical protein
MTETNSRISAALAAYEREHEFARQVTLPVEDKLRYFPQLSSEAVGAYRWFKAEANNLVCLEKVRRLKSQDRR